MLMAIISSRSLTEFFLWLSPFHHSQSGKG